ncbi:MAG: hypothetical protein ACOC6I_02190 [Candidatus Bipolaricaulota bacterium]
MNQKTFNTILALTGFGAFVPGVLEVLFTLTGQTFQWGIIALQGDFTFWRGIILLSSGILYLSAIYHPSLIEKRAQAVLASFMIWIVGGLEVFSTILESITGGEGLWLNTAQGFLNNCVDSFTPAVLLLPISAILVLIVFREERINEG